jgi:nucleoside 2-deoxyribosyltransferase
VQGMRIYLAGPLFSVAEREFNERLAAAMESGGSVNVILPQVYGSRIVGQPGFSQLMFSYCLETIDESDLIVAILDGPDADSGTAVEVSYAYARGKKIIGVRTDPRASEDRGLNLMLSNMCTHLVLCTGTAVTTALLAAEILRHLPPST